MNKVLKVGMRVSVFFCTAAMVAACSTPRPAPVTERAPARAQAARSPAAVVAAPAEAQPEFYTVKRGETLYGIALDHGLAYRDVAEWNQISDPNQIRAGQVLRMRAPAAQPADAVAQTRPVTAVGKVESRPLGASDTAAATKSEGKPAPVSGFLKTEPRAYKLPYSAENVALMTRSSVAREEAKAEEVKPPAKPAEAAASAAAADDEDKVDWAWPSSGRVLAKFSDPTNKGVDVGGKIGDPVFASASGRVVYSGSGLRGYGKLVIIKHNKTFLSAYAHNSQILVKEGQQVVKGQRIAEMGDTDADGPRLHFEIRRLGKPVDPLKYLPEHSS